MLNIQEYKILIVERMIPLSKNSGSEEVFHSRRHQCLPLNICLLLSHPFQPSEQPLFALNSEITAHKTYVCALMALT